MTIALVVAAVVVVLVGGLIGFAATRPNTFRVQRSTKINARAEKVFPLIADFHRWPEWSPWEKLDPAMKRTHSGPPSGKGAVYEWEGNKKVGQGRMEILHAAAPAKVEIKLDFIKPFSANNVTEFTLTPTGNATEVLWSMRGASPFMFKLMGLFMNMDCMIGNDFEKGLAAMKSVAEG
jgi:hypothetical protein